MRYQPVSRFHVVTETTLPRSRRDLPQQAERPGSPRPRFTRGQWLALGVITLVATALRLFHLGTWSFWLDEAHTWRDATIPFGGEFGFVHQGRALYPVAFLLLRALVWAGLGSSEAALRLPFALVGIASVPLLAVAGRRLVGSQSAIAAAALCAVNPWHVYWSQNARGYVLLFLCAAWAANRVGAYAASHRLRDLFAAWAAIVLGALCHPTGLLLALAFAVFLVLRGSPGRNRKVLVALAIGALVLAVFLPWIVAILVPYQDFLQAKADPDLWHFLQTVAYYFRPSLLMAGVLGLALARGPLTRLRVLLLTCFAIVPLIALMLIGGQLVKTTARYAICALPIWLWLAGYGLLRLADLVLGREPVVDWPRRAAAALLPLLLVGEFAAQSVGYFTVQEGDRGRWREACEFAVAHAGKSNLRVLTVSQPTVVYYLRRNQWSSIGFDPYPRITVQPILPWQIASGKGDGGALLHAPGGRSKVEWELEQASRDHAVFVVMVTWPELDEFDSDGQIRAVLAERFELLHYEPCWVGPKDESVYVYGPRRT